MKSWKLEMLAALFVLLVLGGCSASVTQSIPTNPTKTAVPATISIPTMQPSPIPTVTATLPAEPQGCLKPTEDYEILNVNGWLLNRRTYMMLQHAADLYNGEIDITGWAITQGSFHDNGEASFGTHEGGGAVDLAVVRKDTYQVLWDEIPRLLAALRTAGFAAWLREEDELYDGSAIHIHAIAIGDAQLSKPAELQLTGEAGYFRGFSGLPVKNGQPPTPDRFGGPIICQWMKESGYEDLREVK